MKAKLKLFFKFIFDNNTNFDLNSFLTVNSFFKHYDINLDQLLSTNGEFYKLLFQIKNFQSHNCLESSNLVKAIKSIFNLENISTIRLNSDFSNYVINSMIEISNTNYEIVLYLIDIFLEVYNN